MTSVREAIKRLIEPKGKINPGIYHYQTPSDISEPYRLHLRVEENGQGILIVNASTILHLNETAVAYAYHLINDTPTDEVIALINNRYRVNKDIIKDDFKEFKENLLTLIDTPDLDPESFLGFDRTLPYSDDVSAPYRLDCAITYRLHEGIDPDYAPTKRVDRELTTDEWKAIFQKVWHEGIPHLIFTGGEPTLREDLFELLEFAEELGQVTGLNTDGNRLLDTSYFETLLNTGLDHLTLIPDSDDNKSWELVTQCVNADIFFTTHLTVTQNNTNDLPDIITRLKDVGVKNLSLSTSDKSLFSTLSDLRDHIAELGLSLIWDIPVPYSIFNPIALELHEESMPQGAGRAWLYIEPDGDVLPSQGSDLYLGNLSKDTWENIWLNVKNNIS